MSRLYKRNDRLKLTQVAAPSKFNVNLIFRLYTWCRTFRQVFP